MIECSLQDAAKSELKIKTKSSVHKLLHHLVLAPRLGPGKKKKNITNNAITVPKKQIKKISSCPHLVEEDAGAESNSSSSKPMLEVGPRPLTFLTCLML